MHVVQQIKVLDLLILARYFSSNKWIKPYPSTDRHNRKQFFYLYSLTFWKSTECCIWFLIGKGSTLIEDIFHLQQDAFGNPINAYWTSLCILNNHTVSCSEINTCRYKSSLLCSSSIATNRYLGLVCYGHVRYFRERSHSCGSRWRISLYMLQCRARAKINSMIWMRLSCQHLLFKENPGFVCIFTNTVVFMRSC